MRRAASGFTFSGNSENLLDNVIFVKIVAGMSAVLGHIFSIFVGFKGGKGINTAAGLLLGLAPIEFAISLLFFLIGLTSSGMVSLGSIFAAIALPSSLLFRQYVLKADIPGFNFLIFFFTALAILVIYTHRANIQRILNGTESKFPKFQIFKRKV